MAFEVFTKKLAPLANEPYVTLQKRGTISMNKAAHHLMGSPDAVELLYDAEAKMMGFRAIKENVEHAYAIRSMGGQKTESSTYMVSGRAFFRYFDIDTEVARRYPATMNDGILCLDLSTPGTVVTGHRVSKNTSPDGGEETAATLFDNDDQAVEQTENRSG